MARVRIYDITGRTLAWAELASVEDERGRESMAEVGDLVRAARRGHLFFDTEPEAAASVVVETETEPGADVVRVPDVVDVDHERPAPKRRGGQ